MASSGVEVQVPATVKRAIRLFAVFFTGSGLGNLITFLALPVYTRLVSPADFGYFDLSQTVVTIVAALLYADVWVGVMRFSLADGRQADQAIKAGLQFFMLSTLCMVLVSVGVKFAFDPRYLWLTMGLGLARALANFWSFSSRGLGGEKAFAASGVINSIVSFSATVALLVGARAGVVALYLGVVAGSLSQAAFLEVRFRLLRKAWGAQTDSVLRLRLAKFALPLSLNSVAFWAFTGFGRIVVAREMGLEANGVFASASKLSGIVTVVAGVVTLVWQQLAFERGRDDSRFFERGNAVSATVYLFGCTIAIPVGVALYKVSVDQRYAMGWSAVPLFLIVAAMAGYSSFVGNAFYVTERTSFLFWSAVACMLIVLILTIPLVRGFGLNGANLALVLGYAVNIGTKHFFMSKFDRVRAPVVILAWGSVACVVSAWSVLFLSFWWATLVALGSATLFALWSWRSGLGGQLQGVRSS
jgi:O-antigen/teichoic acid export membrane protein